MGTSSPELKQLWIRVLKRVHPDLAIDEQDRIRCERLTQLANEAYQAGDVEALRAVLNPSQTPNTGAQRKRLKRRRKVSPPPPVEPGVHSPAPDIPLWHAFSWKQSLPVAAAVVTVLWIGFALYSVVTGRDAVTSLPTAQAESVSAPIQAHVEVPDAGVWKPFPAKTEGDAIHTLVPRNLTPSPVLDTAVADSRAASTAEVTVLTASDGELKTSPPVTASAEPSHLYLNQMRERLSESFSNYERVDANVPPGNSAEMWFDVNRDGSLSNVRVGKPSGWESLDYACVRAIQRTETVGALPEDYKLRTLPATFACTYNGSNVLRTSRAVDAATERSDLYVGAVRNPAHQ
ncbi:MAG TPA: TonB C-terminal domain-containing protein [Acidobacteriaceae bacterium]|nr:TonB C-terminal domain-containing protein [Acidobacteriaceae bacterium]